MKKLTTILAMTLMAVMTMTVFVSCDVDDEIGNTLSGTWTGRISTYYEDRWGLVGNDYRTTITFYQDGTGEQVDYDVRSPYNDYGYSPFFWTVGNGVITLRYEDTKWKPVYIYDYDLSSYSFRGRMDDGTHRDIVFNLSYNDRFDWNSYGQGGYIDDYGYGYSKVNNVITRSSAGKKAEAKGVFAKENK